jgi:integrase
MLNLAEQWGMRSDGSNPVRHVKKYKEAKRERYLSEPELRRLGKALSDVQADQTETPFTLTAIGLLILTGARLTEILTLKWENVDQRIVS